MQTKTITLLVLLGILGGSSIAHAQGEQLFELLASDGEWGDQLGVSVGLSGSIALIGAPFDDDNGSRSGSAYLFDATTGQQIVKVLAADGEQGDDFGFAVAVNSAAAIIGAPSEDHNGDTTGSAYLFGISDPTNPTLIAKLVGPNASPNAKFGYSVALSGTAAVVGASSDDGDVSWAGSAYLFDSATGQQIVKLTADDGAADDRFGFAVAISGAMALVGAPDDDDNGRNSGSAYLFDTSTGQQLAKLVPNDGALADTFGLSVALRGGVAVVGAPFDDDGANATGSVYLFDTATGQQLAKIIADDLAVDDHFGSSIAISGNLVLIGAPNGNDDQGLDTGSAYLFDITDPQSPSLVVKLLADDGEGADRFGWGAAMNSTSAIVGATFGGNDGTDTGSAYVYSLDADTDGDGLLDSWETEGIPYTDSDGNEFFYVLDVDGDGVSDANPNRKDLFVELDMMSSLSFSQAAVDDVFDAFWAAPVPNPAGEEGITLHIVVDEDTIQFEEITPTPGDSWPADAADLRAAYFGTLPEQIDPDAVELLEAKAKAYRYCLLYNKASTKIGGLGEIGGDDFVIFAGTYNDEDKAAVFMHELGHNLNLDHGGGDDINGKPNYPSIMNYIHSYRETWNNATWKLDYSRERLATLNENALDEQVGIGLGGSGYYADRPVPYFTVVTDGADCFYPNEWNLPAVAYTKLSVGNTQDYNLDCDKDDADVVGDLNHLDDVDLPGSGDPSPGETLNGYDDWANVVLAVSDGGGAFAGTVPSNELTEDQRALINEVFPRPCAADWDVDGLVNTQDFLAYLNDWAAGNRHADLNADGVVNTQDFIAFLNTWVAGCP